MLLSGKLSGDFYIWPYADLCIVDILNEPGSRLSVEDIRKIRHGLVYPRGLLENRGCPESLSHTRYVLYIKVRGAGNVAQMIEHLPVMHEVPGPTSAH